MPLAAHGDTVGMLYFEGPDGGLELIAARVYIELIAENLGLAIANLQLRDRLANLAVKDPLTGLLNRRRSTRTSIDCAGRRLISPLR
jgi:GAF domain-containing protein